MPSSGVQRNISQVTWFFNVQNWSIHQASVYTKKNQVIKYQGWISRYTTYSNYMKAMQNCFLLYHHQETILNQPMGYHAQNTKQFSSFLIGCILHGVRKKLFSLPQRNILIFYVVFQRWPKYLLTVDPWPD